MAKRKLLVAFLVVSISAVILLGALTPLSTPRIFLNQRRATLSVMDLVQAECNYAARLPDTGYACNLGDLGDQGLVGGVLASGMMSGYHFEIGCLKGTSQKTQTFTITALPTNPGITGQFAICADQSGEVWYSENGLASDCLANHKPVERKYRK